MTEEGSKEAQRLVDTLMEACDSEWRGLGIIPGSGLRLRDEWGMYDARKKYQVPKMEGRANPACRCGDVLQENVNHPTVKYLERSVHRSIR